MHQSVLCEQAVRCGAITHTAQLERRRELRDTAEQATRREPQLGAERRRDEKTKTRNENNSYDLHSQLKRNYSGSCGPGVRRSCRSKQKLCLSSHSARCFGFCLSGSTSLKNFFFQGQSPPNLSPLKISFRPGHERKVHTRSGTSCRHHHTTCSAEHDSQI